MLRIAMLLGILPLMAASACSDGCPTLQSCDIRSASCQRTTFEVVQCLRGGKAEQAQVDVRVIDAERFIDAQVETSEPPSQQTLDARRGLSLLRLFPEDSGEPALVRQSWQRVAAFFSPSAGGVTVLDRGNGSDGQDAVILLAHEYVHALQSAEAKPDPSRYRDSFDGQLAWGAMLEGEADLFQGRALLEGYGIEPAGVEWRRIYRSYREKQWDEARDRSVPITLSYQQFAYAFGGEYLNRAWREHGAALVRELLTDPPISARQVLAGPIPEPADRPAFDEPNEVGHPILGEPYEQLNVSRLGAWGFEVFRDRWSQNPRALADYRDEGFSGDVLTIVRDPRSDEVSVIWRLRFDDEARSEQMLYELRESTPFKFERIGRDLVLVGSTASDLPDALDRRLQWSEQSEPPPLSDDDAPAQLCVEH
jgi:hypothetical protein